MRWRQRSRGLALSESTVSRMARA